MSGCPTLKQPPHRCHRLRYRLRPRLARRRLLSHRVKVRPALPRTGETTPLQLPPGTYALPASSVGVLYTLARAYELDAPWATPVARSYDGHEWELVQPAALDVHPPALSCSASGAYTIEVPNDATGEREAARFLIQTSYGPTKVTVASLAAELQGANNRPAVFRDLAAAQMALPGTSHRAYWHEHTSPRAVPSGSSLGGERSPCQVGSRWHRWAFTTTDVGATENVRVLNGMRVASVNGVARTNVEGWTLSEAGDYRLCSVEEKVAGALTLRPCDGFCEVVNEAAMQIMPMIQMMDGCSETAFNLAIDFGSFNLLDSGLVHDFGAALPSVMPVPHVPDALVITEWGEGFTCELTAAARTDAFMSLDGLYYRHDPRVRLLENSLGVHGDVSSPWATETLHEAGEGAYCPVVAKTFLNELYCVPTMDCRPIVYKSTPVTLQVENLRMFYEIGERLVYYVGNLKLTPPYDMSACAAASRWKRETFESCDETLLDSISKAALVATLEASMDTNPHVRDLGAIGCGSADGIPIGACVRAAGACWEHIHPDEYSVFDFNTWSALHSCGMDKITKWAQQGLAYLAYPDTHDMFRFADHKRHLAYLGRLGDEVVYDELPSITQSQAMAEQIGAIAVVSSEPFEACSSPGEVQNRPESGHKYGAWMAVNQRGAKELYAEYEPSNGKRMVHTMTALYAADQLRQRVGWALSQIFVVGESGLELHTQEQEMWLTYFDIFIRNAFGNYRDIMREVSYSPVMGMFLTTVDSKSLAFGSPPTRTTRAS